MPTAPIRPRAITRLVVAFDKETFAAYGCTARVLSLISPARCLGHSINTASLQFKVYIPSLGWRSCFIIASYSILADIPVRSGWDSSQPRQIRGAF